MTQGKLYLPDVTRGVFRSASQHIGYQISKHNIPEIWKQTKGDGVTIAVLDTGCQMTHVDLVESLIHGRSFDGDKPVKINDRDGHGTHVTGIITANNNEQGIVGVAPEAKVLIVRVLNAEGWSA